MTDIGDMPWKARFAWSLLKIPAKTIHKKKTFFFNFDHRSDPNYILAPASEGVGADPIGLEISRVTAVSHDQRNIALIWKRLSVRTFE